MMNMSHTAQLGLAKEDLLKCLKRRSKYNLQYSCSACRLCSRKRPRLERKKIELVILPVPNGLPNETAMVASFGW